MNTTKSSLYWMIKNSDDQYVFNTFEESEYYSIKSFLRSNLLDLTTWEDAVKHGYRVVEIMVRDVQTEQ